MELILTRYGSTPMGTFGELVFGNHVVQTVERPYLGNAGRISCVPAGHYVLEPHESQSKWIGKTLALVNHKLGVYHWEDENALRTVILMHIANHMHQLEGCIGLGLTLGCVGFEGKQIFGVHNSTKAVDLLREVVDVTQHHTLLIKWLEPEKEIYRG